MRFTYRSYEQEYILQTALGTYACRPVLSTKDQPGGAYGVRDEMRVTVFEVQRVGVPLCTGERRWCNRCSSIGPEPLKHGEC